MEERKCACGNIMNTKHDDRKFEIDGKEFCIECLVRITEAGYEYKQSRGE